MSIGSVGCSEGEWSSCLTGNSTGINDHEDDVFLSCEYGSFLALVCDVE